ncbi:hypothetical protein BG015_001631 [Linnemannia schmuckeri]|uniref:F-box domain-containing protein n=1 Tax=Linnemannia schmuckeri TaxID=64567 RepID=A0A9P5SAV2_9FUNG|nr:hypothetical protein BG015_001631 [Linnemannia schmuckeri]
MWVELNVTVPTVELKPTITTAERSTRTRTARPKTTVSTTQPTDTIMAVKLKVPTRTAKAKATASTLEPKVAKRTVEPKATTTTAEPKAKTRTLKAKIMAPTAGPKHTTTTVELKAKTRTAKPKAPAPSAESKTMTKTRKPKAIAPMEEPKAETRTAGPKATTATPKPKAATPKLKATTVTPKPSATTKTGKAKSTTTTAKLKTMTKTAKVTTTLNHRKRGADPTSSSIIDSPFAKRRKAKASGVQAASGDGSVTEEQSLLPRRPIFVNIIQTSRLLKMSDEILIWILIWVHCQKSVCRVSSTCKRLWSVAQDPYLWKFITLHHDTVLRRHWDTQLHPRLLSSNIYELNLVGEISSPVLIDTLKLDQFTGLRTLRLEDIQTYTVYRLASKLPWLKVFEARKIKGNSDRWDWSPFSNLTQLEELLLWRNEKPTQTFSLSDDMMIETPDDVYPGDGVNGGFGGFVQLSNSNSPMMDSDEEMAEDDDGTEDAMDTEGSIIGDLEEVVSVYSLQSLGAGAAPGSGTGGSDDSGVSITPVYQTPQQQHHRTRRRMMPQLKRLALVNIVSPTANRGTDSVMRSLVSRVTTFLHWNSFNILFPVVRTEYDQLVNLTMVEPCEPAWQEGTWQEHAAVFRTMKLLETITWINPHMQRRYLIPILEVLLLSLDRLRVIHMISTDEDTQVLQMILTHVLETRWTGQLTVSIQGDLGADPSVRDWCTCAKEAVRVANLDDAMKDRPLVFAVKLFRTEWDEDAGLKRLCLKAWQQTLH